MIEPTESFGRDTYWNRFRDFLLRLAMLVGIVLMGHVSVPDDFQVPRTLSLMIAYAGIISLFGILQLLPQPLLFVPFRSIGQLLIASGILSAMSYTMSGLEVIAGPVSRDRAYNVSTVMMTTGLASLIVYWMLNWWVRAANNPMKPDGGSGGS